MAMVWFGFHSFCCSDQVLCRTCLENNNEIEFEMAYMNIGKGHDDTLLNK